MGLANLNTAAGSNLGARLHLLHFKSRVPLYADEKAKTGAVTMLLLGKDSDAYIKAEYEARERNVENMSRQVKWSAAESDHTTSETLARCTQQWENVPKCWIEGGDDESPAECTYENALKLYENPGFRWVREQVEEFINERANFLKA